VRIDYSGASRKWFVAGENEDDVRSIYLEKQKREIINIWRF
jgi:hypothetical protein